MRKSMKQILALAMTVVTMVTGASSVSAAKLSFETNTSDNKLYTYVTKESNEYSFIVEYMDYSTKELQKRCRYYYNGARDGKIKDYAYTRATWVRVKSFGKNKADKTLYKHMYYTCKAPKVTLSNYSSTSTRVKINWTKRAGSTGYYIYQSRDAQNWTKIATVGASTSSYVSGNIGVGYSNRMYFKVRAFKKIDGKIYTGSGPDYVQGRYFS